MKKLSKHQLETIVHKSLPGYTVVETDPVSVDGPLPAQMKSAGLAKIQEKLSAQVGSYLSADDVIVTDAEGEDVVQAVEIAPRSGRFSNERKTVLVSAAKEEIVGRQG